MYFFIEHDINNIGDNHAKNRSWNYDSKPNAPRSKPDSFGIYIARIVERIVVNFIVNVRFRLKSQNVTCEVNAVRIASLTTRLYDSMGEGPLKFI